MADKKISELTSLPGSSLAATDELAVVDTSASETKKITAKEAVQYGYGLIDPSTLDGNVIEPGTTSARGTVQLTDSTSSTSTTTAATPNAVKGAYDLANAALPKTGGTMTGQILGDNSTSASTPGYAFDGDPNTGLYTTGADELALTTGGSARLTIDSTGTVVIPGNFTVQGTTTTIDTTTLVVEDKNIEMGAVATPTDVTADGGGITLKGTTDKTINWVDATDAWTSSERFSVPTGTAAAPTLTFTGDPNTGIYSPGADQLALSTSGTGRLFIDASGKVGIGTASPSEQLHLTGSLYAESRIYAADGAAATPSIRFYNSNVGLYSPGSGALGFSTGSSERLRIDSSGRVGIGTSSPSNTIDVVGTARITGNTGIGTAPNPAVARLFISETPGVTGANLIGLGDGNGVHTYLKSNGSATFAGSVGIGTTSPSNSLNVVGIADFDGGAVSTTSRLRIQPDEGTKTVFLDSRTSVGNSELAIKTGPAGGSTERCRIDGSGRLLVGTSSSSAGTRLVVEGNSAGGSGQPGITTLALSANTLTDGSALGVLAFSDNGHTQAATIAARRDGGTWTSGSSQPSRLVFSTTADGASSPTERMRLTNEGRLLLGTTNAYGRVHAKDKGFNPESISWLNAAFVVSGSFGGGFALLDGSKGYSMYTKDTGNDLFIRHHTTTTAAGSGGVTLNDGATSWTSASDEREKENLTLIEDAIAKVKSLRAVTGNYTWSPNTRYAFLIAQDVQQVLPEAVSVINKDAKAEDQRLGLAYSQTIPLLTAALQEAVGEIESLKARVAALESA